MIRKHNQQGKGHNTAQSKASSDHVEQEKHRFEEAHEQAEHDMEEDIELSAHSPNDDLDEGETARLGEDTSRFI